MLTLANASYLIVISRREHVAQIHGSSIFAITDVALIPLSSRSEAANAIDQANDCIKTSSAHDVESELSDDGQGHDDSTEDGIETSPASTEFPILKHSIESEPDPTIRNSSKVAEDVIGKKGQYGRFTERWFSKNGWSTEKRRVQGMSTHEGEKTPSVSSPKEKLQSPSVGYSQTEQSVEAISSGANIETALLPKLLQTTRMLLGSRSFFFSYDFDITRRFGSEAKRSTELPLYKSVDPLFFWNHHLALHFIEGRHHSFVLPLMQGFVGQRAFTIKDKGKDNQETLSSAYQGEGSGLDDREHSDIDCNLDLLLTLISRRSVKRPGLRYLRRGVDDKGDVANFVETEQILSKASWAPLEKVYSFTQIRGSIPLFFSQSPYSFRPIPIMQHSSETNRRALRQHFSNLVSRYDGVQIVLLVDKKGNESELGRKYEESVTDLNSGGGIAAKQINFEWFDFHTICRGMKFENVTILTNSLGPRLDEFGYTVERGSEIQQRQSGVLRTNCMDCLDRTNVVQSACGQRALEQQLQGEGFKIDLLTDRTTEWFNTLWADNGDQISKEYSSTAALKGDYTRTRRRGYRGAINDLGLSVSRYYNNVVNGKDRVYYKQGLSLKVFRLFRPGCN